MKKVAAALAFGFVMTLVVGCGGEANPQKKGEAPIAPAGPGKNSVQKPKAAE